MHEVFERWCLQFVCHFSQTVFIEAWDGKNLILLPVSENPNDDWYVSSNERDVIAIVLCLAITKQHPKQQTKLIKFIVHLNR